MLGCENAQEPDVRRRQAMSFIHATITAEEMRQYAAHDMKALLRTTSITPTDLEAAEVIVVIHPELNATFLQNLVHTAGLHPVYSTLMYGEGPLRRTDEITPHITVRDGVTVDAAH